MIKPDQNGTAVIAYILFFCSVFGYGQLQLKDSTWLPIYVKDTVSVSYQTSDVNYSTLFYKSVYVPEYHGNSKDYLLKPLAQNISELLVQTELDKSYSTSEVRGTELEKSLRTFEKMSFPFASSITSKLAEKLELKTNKPILVARNDSLLQLSINDKDVLFTHQALDELHNDASLRFDQSLYLRRLLLHFIVGNTNEPFENYHWKKVETSTYKAIVPYIDFYQNQYMSFDGTYKLITKLVQSYKHFEPYDSRIKNLKNTSQKHIGFDVNMLSNLSFEFWEVEMDFIKNTLSNQVVDAIIAQLPKGAMTSKTEQLTSVLKQRIANIKEIGTAYYNLISPNKVVVATNVNNLIDIKKNNTGVSIQLYNEIDGKNNPIKSYNFLSEETKSIWVYGLKGNDYFEVSGQSKKDIPIRLIGGVNSDKYEINNGKKVVVYDNERQSFIIHKDNAKFKLSEDEYVTKYTVDKYRHTANNIKPKFGANPDDGLFIGAVNDYRVLNFDQNPFSQLHQISANFYLSTQGFNLKYYGEKANVYKGFNAFVSLGYQSPNYSTNFFGYGNETPNYDDNLKLDYNRVRMENMDVALGLLKRHSSYNASASLFFESRKIDETPDRFVSSETLFFPENDFFDRKNYIGLSGAYSYKNMSLDLVEDLIITPKIDFKVTANLNEFSKTNSLIQPSIHIAHPFYNDKISLDAKITYQYVFGEDVPFYQAATIGGASGLRGYRNQRFTGQSSVLANTNIRWFIKDLESDILPLQFGVLGGFDAGRVWLKKEHSTRIHTDFGGGFWLQTADLLKAEAQAFKGNEGMRFSFNISIGF
mgnify:CR=1 FL=1